MAKYDCSAVVLSFNTKKVTDLCLKKAETAARYAYKTLGSRVKIIAVDNGSTDGSPEMIKRKHQIVKLIRLKENTGYAKGNNAGLRLANTPFILLINSDLYLAKNTFVSAIKYMQNNKSCDVLSCKVVNAEGSFEPYGGHLPTPFKTILWALGLESWPIVKYFLPRIYGYNLSFYQEDKRMEWCPTCFFFLRREVYKKTKGFDENLFLYMEDVEWCQRIGKKDFQLIHTPSFQVVHLGGASQKSLTSQEVLRRQIEGMEYFHKVHYPNTYWIVVQFLRFGLKLRTFFYLLSGNLEQAKIYYFSR